jgi:hypothetical protein
MTFSMLGACVPAYTLVSPGTIAVGDLFVNTADAWNQAPSAVSAQLRKGSQLWTRDGLLLDRLLIIPGVPDGEALMTDRSKTAALPVFRANMLANELEELTESTMTKYLGEGNSAVSTSNLRPWRFGEQRGVMFDLQVAVNDRPDYSGMVGAFVANHSLYLVIYLAAEPYYYGKHLAEAESIIRSARLQAPG